MTYSSKHLRGNNGVSVKTAPATNLYNAGAKGANATRAQVSAVGYWKDHMLHGRPVEIFTCFCTDGIVILAYGQTGTNGAPQTTVISTKAYGATDSHSKKTVAV